MSTLRAGIGWYSMACMSCVPSVSCNINIRPDLSACCTVTTEQDFSMFNMERGIAKNSSQWHPCKPRSSTAIPDLGKRVCKCTYCASLHVPYYYSSTMIISPSTNQIACWKKKQLPINCLAVEVGNWVMQKLSDWSTMEVKCRSTSPKILAHLAGPTGVKAICRTCYRRRISDNRWGCC